MSRVSAASGSRWRGSSPAAARRLLDELAMKQRIAHHAARARLLIAGVVLAALPFLVAACQQQGGGNTGY
jgi:hypothetical protein